MCFAFGEAGNAASLSLCRRYLLFYVLFLSTVTMKIALGFAERRERYAPSHQRNTVLGFYVLFLSSATMKIALGFAERCERYAPSHQRKAVLGFYVTFLPSAAGK